MEYSGRAYIGSLSEPSELHAKVCQVQKQGTIMNILVQQQQQY